MRMTHRFCVRESLTRWVWSNSWNFCRRILELKWSNRKCGPIILIRWQNWRHSCGAKCPERRRKNDRRARESWNTMRRVQNRVFWMYQRLRVAQFRFFADCERVEGKPLIRQPVQFTGRGIIRFNGTVNLGFFPSPYFLSGYIYMEARSESSIIQVEDGVWMNNSVCL